MGVTPEHLPNDLSVALGAASVTPMEMAIVFNCFTNGGKKTPPLMIREIRAHDNVTVEESHEPKPVQAMKPETAYVLRSMMFDVIRGGTGGRAKLAKAEAFGKTGTSNEFIDAWFIGGAPGLTTAIYAGNDDHKSLKNVYGAKPSPVGGIVAAPAWKNFMDFAVERMRTPLKFDEPPAWLNVDRVTICRTTGFKARQGCQPVPLYMPRGVSPTAGCPTHGGNYGTALGDPNAPRLFLIEQDEYAEPETEYYPQHPGPGPAPEPIIPPNSEPVYRDLAPTDNFDERYEKLLRDYGIK
jgi:penicillin-binding protein 1A